MSLREHLRSLGGLVEAVEAELLPSTLLGGTPWPGGRAGWRTVVRPATTLLATDGLAGPGGGCELFMEWPRALPEPRRAALALLMRATSNAVAGDLARVESLLAREGSLTVEHRGLDVPHQLQECGRRSIVLLGPPRAGVPATFQAGGRTVPFIHAVPLHAAEVVYWFESDDREAQRRKLAALLRGEPMNHGGQPLALPSADLAIDPFARYEWWLRAA